MTTWVWAGVTIDPTLLSNRGYLDIISVGGVSYQRWAGYMAAAILQVGTTVTAANAALTGTSTTSLTVQTGAASWVTQAGLGFVAGHIVTLSAVGNNAVMCGTVTSYDPVGGVLVVNVLDTFGSGTYSSWAIAVSGRMGPTGPQGSTGSQGPAGAGATINAALNGTVVTGAARGTANFQQSITVADNSGASRFDVNLSGDSTSPGNDKFYGTSSSGTKGWNDLAARIAALVPFANNTDAQTGTSTTKAMTPASTVAALPGRLSKTTIFTSSGTFTKDSRTVAIIVEAIGGGCGAASVTAAGGSHAYGVFPTADVASSVTVTIGAGGAGAIATNGSTGNPGGTTTFGALLVAIGGSAARNNGLFVAGYLQSWINPASGNGGVQPTGGSSGAAGLIRGDSAFVGITGGDGTPGTGSTGNTTGTVTAGNATAATIRCAGGPSGGAATNTNATGNATAGNGGAGGHAGGGGGAGGSAFVSGSGTATAGTGGAGGNGEVVVTEIFGQ